VRRNKQEDQEAKPTGEQEGRTDNRPPLKTDLMTDTDDIEVLYARFEDLLIRCFAAAYSGAAWDLPSQFNLAQTRADLRRHRQFDEGRYNEIVLRVDRVASTRLGAVEPPVG
jgi:hypothetical protein